MHHHSLAAVAHKELLHRLVAGASKLRHGARGIHGVSVALLSWPWQLRDTYGKKRCNVGLAYDRKFMEVWVSKSPRRNKA
jgi:hypothetical protein